MTPNRKEENNMGLYDSNLSVWERNKLGLPMDHCGDGVIGETPKPVEPEIEIEKEEAPKPITKVNKRTGL